MRNDDDDRGTFARKFAAMSIGNVMEWFDFSSFSAMVDIIGDLYFPSEHSSHAIQLMKALGVFGIAFLMRPIGGIFIGWIGDTAGRRRALEISIILMLFPSFLIGCLPTYSQIGILAPICLLILRCLQGLAAGGETVGAYIYTIEATGGKNVCFWGGACKATSNLGTALGLGVVTGLRISMDKDSFLSWGWRLPFWLGLLFGIIGLWVRSSLTHVENNNGEEFDVANRQQIIKKTPIIDVIHNYSPEMLVVILVVAFWACSFYTSFIWLVYYMKEEELSGSGSVHHARLIVFLANLGLVVALPLAGSLGDFSGRILNNTSKGLLLTMQFALFLMIALVIPAFLLILTKRTLFVVIGQLMLLVPVAIYGACLPAFMVDQFLVQYRFSGIGISYNIASALFSSTVSLIQTELILAGPSNDQKEALVLSDHRLRPAYYLIGVAILSYLGLTFGVALCKERRARTVLNEDVVPVQLGRELRDFETVSILANAQPIVCTRFILI